MKPNDFVEVSNTQSRCTICDEIYSILYEQREGLCEVCNQEIDNALNSFNENDDEEKTLDKVEE